MSSDATPITPERFTKAIKELPLANLHFKAAEIRNSVAHLVSSNQQLQPCADEGDADCADAIEDNLVVIQRMKERIVLLKGEVEGRGFKWAEEGSRPENVESKGHASGEEVRVASWESHSESSTRPYGRRLGDEELARRLREQLEESNENEAQGVHL